MTVSAYNLGKSGLASKVLRIMDLMLAAMSESSSVLRIGAVCFSVAGVGSCFGAPCLGVRSMFLSELLGMSQFALLRFLSKGWMSQVGAVEKEEGRS